MKTHAELAVSQEHAPPSAMTSFGMVVLTRSLDAQLAQSVAYQERMATWAKVRPRGLDDDKGDENGAAAERPPAQLQQHDSLHEQTPTENAYRNRAERRIDVLPSCAPDTPRTAPAERRGNA